MKYFLLCLITFSIISTSSHASVWEATPGKTWDSSWEKKYSTWITQKVGPSFFKKLGKPFKDLKIDCADAHYALLAYFSYMHKLPMVALSGRISYKTKKFDYIKKKKYRLSKFISSLADRLGTEAIAHHDTYPVALKKIQPGDIFTYKVGRQEFTRHTYIIKNINIDGTFDVLYSTQNRKEKGLPLNRHRSYIFKKAPLNTGVDKNHWGFRRAKRPDQMKKSQEELVRAGVGSFEQYSYANNLGRLNFFRKVKQMHQKINESPKMIVNRNLNNICQTVRDRALAVQAGIDYNAKINHRCMNLKEYDTYSTPSRDSGIMDDFSNLGIELKKIVNSHQQNVAGKLFRVSQMIFDTRGLNEWQSQQVFNFCPIKTFIGDLDLANFRQLLFDDLISYHPNDNIFYRWGMQYGQRTRCRTFYGYPH